MSALHHFNAAMLLLACMATLHAETNVTESAGTNLAVAASTVVAPAITPTPPVDVSATNVAGFDLAAFKILNERNIFNANRSPAEARGAVGAPKKVIRVNSLSLVGTMSSSKGTLAFFDGNASSYKKALKQGDTLADFTLTEIQPNSVQLKYKDNILKVSVGGQLRQQEEEDWKLTDSAEPLPTSSTPGTAEAAATDSDSSSVEDPILKRLMEQREKEFKK